MCVFRYHHITFFSQVLLAFFRSITRQTLYKLSSGPFKNHAILKENKTPFKRLRIFTFLYYIAWWVYKTKWITILSK